MTGHPYSHKQKMPIVFGILSIVLVLVILQLWLLTATMNAYLAGDGAVIIPEAAGSLALFALNAGLLVYLYRMERR